MGRRHKQRQKESDSENATSKPSPYLSVKDSIVILFLSTILSVGLVTGTYGISGISQKLCQNDLMDILATFFLFICLFAVISFLLVKFAAHYLVYLGIGIFFSIIFPVSRRRQRAAIKEVYEKAVKRD